MLPAIGLLLVCQLAGEVIARAVGIPVPGPVLGLVILALALALGPVPAERIEGTALGRTAGGLLGVLGILFVPAGVGVIQQLKLLGQYGVALGVALVVSTVLTMVVTVFTFLAVARWTRR